MKSMQQASLAEKKSGSEPMSQAKPALAMPRCFHCCSSELMSFRPRRRTR